MSTMKQKDLMAKITARIAANGVGWKLPAQEELCKQYAVSRTLLREVLSILEFLGIINVRPKTGTVVANARDWRYQIEEVSDLRKEMLRLMEMATEGVDHD